MERPGYTEIHVPVVRLSSLFERYGVPEFAKIDVEHSDTEVLRDLLSTNSIPPHLSVEAHVLEVLLLVHQMGYSKFRLVNCRRIAEQYGDAVIATPTGSVRYSFPEHSSGPFGEDLPLEWITRHSLYSLNWFDWYDVHASGRVLSSGGIRSLQAPRDPPPLSAHLFDVLGDYGARGKVLSRASGRRVDVEKVVSIVTERLGAEIVHMTMRH